MISYVLHPDITEYFNENISNIEQHEYVCWVSIVDTDYLASHNKMSYFNVKQHINMHSGEFLFVDG